MRWKAPQIGPWPSRGTKGRDRCRRYCSPAALAPPVPTALLGDGAVSSTAATEPPGVATGPSGSSQSTLQVFRRIRNSCASPACTEPVRSEEHTSELQSLRHLVCRLLLEKIKRT